MSHTLAEITARTGFAVLEHLEAEAHVPVLPGLQAQGDLLIVPLADAAPVSHRPAAEVPGTGIAVIEPVGSGHEHRLFAGAPGTATFGFAATGGQDIGVLECTEPAFLLHPEHGATGVAPGSYVLRRQREQADEERLIAD
ncbi:MAG TPA: hypothetical protein VHZ03_14070 [Trebonia sp.]|jgi:hypothetical protein|nr:hypothetical protein [Trebonia sp.]